MGKKAKSAVEFGTGSRQVGRLRGLLVYVAALTTISTICFCPQALAQAPSVSPRQTVRILGVRKVLRESFLCTTRYSRIHDFDVYFYLRLGEQTYCGDYETTVLDEINDLMSSDGKDIAAILDTSRKRITLYTLQNRKLKARILRMSQCLPAALAQNNSR